MLNSGETSRKQIDRLEIHTSYIASIDEWIFCINSAVFVGYIHFDLMSVERKKRARKFSFF